MISYKRNGLFVVAGLLAVTLPVMTVCGLSLKGKTDYVSERQMEEELPEEDDLTFREYSYRNEGADGSWESVVLYPQDDSIICLDTIYTANGGYCMRTDALGRSQSEQFEGYLSRAYTVSGARSASLTLSNGTGVSVVRLDAFPMESLPLGHGLTDEDAVFYSLHSVSDMADDPELFRRITGYVSDAQLAAYINMVYQQVSNFETESFTLQSVTVIDSYSYDVTTSTGRMFRVTTDGYFIMEVF